MPQQHPMRNVLRAGAALVATGTLAAAATACEGSEPITPDPHCKNRNPQKHRQDAGCEMRGAPAPEVIPPVPGTQPWALAYANPLASTQPSSAPARSGRPQPPMRVGVSVAGAAR